MNLRAGSWLLSARYRRTLPVAVGAAAFLLVLAARGGEPAPGDSPLVVVEAFDAAARRGDAEAMYVLLGPRSRASLEAASKRANQLLAVRARVPSAMIRSAGSAAARTFEIVSFGGDRAVVEISEGSGRSAVDVVLTDDGWRIELRQR